MRYLLTLTISMFVLGCTGDPGADGVCSCSLEARHVPVTVRVHEPVGQYASWDLEDVGNITYNSATTYDSIWFFTDLPASHTWLVDTSVEVHAFIARARFADSTAGTVDLWSDGVTSREYVVGDTIEFYPTPGD